MCQGTWWGLEGTWREIEGQGCPKENGGHPRQKKQHVQRPRGREGHLASSQGLLRRQGDAEQRPAGETGSTGQ